MCHSCAGSVLVSGLAAWPGRSASADAGWAMLRDGTKDRAMHPLHPPLVHLPIGLLVGNAILTGLYLRRGDRSVEVAAYHCLWLGWLLLWPAVISGTYEALRELAATSPARTDALGWINAHALAGCLLLVVYWQAWQQRRRQPDVLDDRRARRSYLARLALGLLLLVVDGWLGGQLVYGLGIGIG